MVIYIACRTKPSGKFLPQSFFLEILAARRPEVREKLPRTIKAKLDWTIIHLKNVLSSKRREMSIDY